MKWMIGRGKYDNRKADERVSDIYILRMRERGQRKKVERREEIVDLQSSSLLPFPCTTPERDIHSLTHTIVK